MAGRPGALARLAPARAVAARDSRRDADQVRAACSAANVGQARATALAKVIQWEGLRRSAAVTPLWRSPPRNDVPRGVDQGSTRPSSAARGSVE